MTMRGPSALLRRLRTHARLRGVPKQGAGYRTRSVTRTGRLAPYTSHRWAFTLERDGMPMASKSQLTGRSGALAGDVALLKIRFLVHYQQISTK
jgi:hypothetical protein